MKNYTDCAEVQEEFSALLDGELTGDDREAVEEHLGDCSECLRKLDQMYRVNSRFAGLAPVSAPAGFEAQVRRRATPARRLFRRARRAPFTLPRFKTPQGMTGAVVGLAALLILTLTASFSLLQYTLDTEYFAREDVGEGDTATQSLMGWDPRTETASDGAATEAEPMTENAAADGDGLNAETDASSGAPASAGQAAPRPEPPAPDGSDAFKVTDRAAADATDEEAVSDVETTGDGTSESALSALEELRGRRGDTGRSQIDVPMNTAENNEATVAPKPEPESPGLRPRRSSGTDDVAGLGVAMKAQHKEEPPPLKFYELRGGELREIDAVEAERTVVARDSEAFAELAESHDDVTKFAELGAALDANIAFQLGDTWYEIPAPE